MQRGRPSKRVAPAGAGSTKRGRHADSPASAANGVPRGRTAQQISEDNVQLELYNPAEETEPGSRTTSSRVTTRSRAAALAADASQGAGHGSGQMPDTAQLPATGNALDAELPTSGPDGRSDGDAYAVLCSINQAVSSQAATKATVVAKLTDIEKAIKNTVGKQVAIIDSDKVTKPQADLFRKALKAIIEEKSMFQDDPMVERAVARVMSCGDDVDKAREASKMFAALTKKASKTASTIRQDFAKVAKEAVLTSFCWTAAQAKAKGWGLAPILPPDQRGGGGFLNSTRAQRLLRDDRYRTTAPANKTQAFNFVPFRMAVAAAIHMQEDPELRLIKTTASKVAFIEQLVRRHLQGQRDIPHQSDQLQVWVQEYKVLLRKTEQHMQDSAHIITSQSVSEAEGF